MNNISLINSILSHINHTVTIGQKSASEKLIDFFLDKTPQESKIFILKGYAGTGKTTLISAFINFLDENKIKNVLLSPTGRAAKVLSNYSGKQAYTIHKCIYRKKSTKSENSSFNLNYNRHQNTFFIVDEASMIGNTNMGNSLFGSGYLLEDLLNFVFSNDNCKLIFIGDTAQLPPIGTSISPALDSKELEYYNMQVREYTLSEVVRQSSESGILYNATKLREAISFESFFADKMQLLNFNDIIALDGSSVIEELEDCYSKYGENETKIICKSNKTAVKYNLGIRNRILWKDEEISYGDLLLIIKNNYFWLPENETIDFIANGDIVKVVRTGRIQEIYGHRYIDLTIQFVDYPEIEIEVKAIMDSLTSEATSLGNDYYTKIYEQLLLDYAHITKEKERQEAILADKYYNALQIKFAYALTCHKSQGGQWEAVFIDHGWLNSEALSQDDKKLFYRWLYTAVTRATKKLFLVNFTELLVENNS